MRRHATGFGLVELLVVIAIVTILMGILLPVAARVREISRRTVCSRNLQQAGAALQIYANAHHGKVPQHPLDGHMGESFASQLPRPTAQAIVPRGARRDIMYCPSGDLTADTALWSEDEPQSYMCATGYHWFMRRTKSGPPPLNPPKRYLTTLSNVANPAMVELAADLVVSHRGRFTGLREVNPPEENNKPHTCRTSHLRGGDKPEGGNILFLDGHVSWRPFEDMIIRGGLNDLWF